MRRETFLSVASVMVLVCWPAAITQAAEFQICTDGGGQYYPDIAYNWASRHYLAVWECTESGNSDVIARVVDGDGNAITGMLNIATTSTPERFPAVAGKSGQYLVVWVEYGTGSVYGQRVASDGTKVGGRITIAVTSDSSNRYPDVTYSSHTDEYLVVWAESRDSDWNVYAKLVGTNGSVGSEIAVCTAASGQYFPRVAYNFADQEFLVVWKDETGADGIYGQRVADSGVTVGGNFAISSTSAVSPTYPAVAYNSYDRNEYLVVWQETRNGGWRDIYGRRVSASGSPLGSEIRISSTDERDEWYPDVAYARYGCQYKVVWGQKLADGSRDVWAQRVNSDGTLAAGNYTVCAGVYDQEMPSITYGTEMLTVWQDSRDISTTVFDIYGDHEAEPAMEVCGTGSVDAAVGPPVDVLFVNAGEGGCDRVVEASTGGAILVTMNAPPSGPSPAPFALYVWLGQPSFATVTPHPKKLGKMCFPTPLAGGAPQPKKIWNNIGRYADIGYPDFDSTPAPSTVFSKPSGFQNALTVTFQGFILDSGSSATKPASITNAVTLDISP